MRTSAFQEEVRSFLPMRVSAADGVTSKSFVMCVSEVERLKEPSSNGLPMSSLSFSIMSSLSDLSRMSSSLEA